MAASSHHLTRRSLLTAATAASFAAPACADPGAWTWDAYMEAMGKSGRPADLTEAQFWAIQARKPAAMRRIESYLQERLGSADPAVLRAFQEVPREYFHYLYSDRCSQPGAGYEDSPKPWALGHGSALPDYLSQAYMAQLCRPAPTDITLEVGTGSGFQCSLLSRIVSRSYSIEIIEPLGHAVGKIFAPLGYANIETRVGDGYFGWPEVQGGFDIIIVTCAAQYTPPELFRQLKPGGRMLIPITQPFKRGQLLHVYTRDRDGKVSLRRDAGVFFMPMTRTILPPGVLVSA